MKCIFVTIAERLKRAQSLSTSPARPRWKLVLKILKEKANLNYTVAKIYEDDEKEEKDLISGKKSLEKEAAMKS